MAKRIIDPSIAKQAKVAKLLELAQWHMLPSGIKHTYLASVANVLCNPVAKLDYAKNPNDPDLVFVAGWGDMHRTIPLLVIADLNTENKFMIRHAFTPNPNARTAKATDTWAIDMLQKDEYDYAGEHDVMPRDIKREIIRRGRNNAMTRGINRSDANFTDQEIKDLYQNWFITDYLHPDLEFTTKPDTMNLRDLRKLELNINSSITNNTARKNQNVNLHLDRDLHNKLVTNRIVCTREETDDDFEF